jgi:hypothetical protein
VGQEGFYEMTEKSLEPTEPIYTGALSVMAVSSGNQLSPSKSVPIPAKPGYSHRSRIGILASSAVSHV